MKRHFYKFVFAVSILGILGFGECNEAIEEIIGLYVNYISGGDLTGTNGDGVGEMYSIAVGNEGAIYTRSGRPPAEWIERTSGTDNTLRFVRVYNDTTLTIAASVGDAGTVLQSIDKGETWTDISIAGLTENLYGLDLFYQGTGFEPGLVVCGKTGSMNFSTNFGSSWEPVITPTTQNLNSVAAIDKSLFIVVGDGGTILKTYDRGGDWEDHTVGGAKFNRIFDGIEVEAYGYLWIVGDGGRIYATTNYGISWFPQNSGVTENLYDVIFSSQNDGIVVGAHGVVRYTQNGGLLWQEDPDLSGLTLKDIVSISKIDENTASALLVSNFNRESSIGNDTTFILSVSSEPFVGVDDDENSIPSDFILEQNYPNPFNPSTTIEFSITDASFVALEIFNALGEKITTLVSKELSAGNHKYDWNPGNQPGGIYFYKLSTNSFEQTKKLVLLK